MDILQAAIEYAECGFSVIPVRRSDKTPYTQHGLKDASRDPDVITAWWNRWPEANVAIACGKPSGNLFVIDIDIKPEIGKHGDQSVEAWQAKHGDFPETVSATTGSGGKHLFFRSGSIHLYKNKVDAIPSVDIRGDGAYVVVSPSVYTDGRAYSWDRGVSILDTDEIADANRSVIELLELNPKISNKAPEKSDKVNVQKAVVGNRNDTLFRYACSQRGANVPYDVALISIRAMNETLDPPLPDTEVIKTLDSAFKYPVNEVTIYGGTAEPEPQEDDLEMPTLEDFAEEDVNWLIPGYIPKEQITLICGTGGTGKTSFWISLIASLSSGARTLFDGTKEDYLLPKREPMKVMFFSGEDTVEHVIKKKLHMQRANMRNITTISLSDERFAKVQFGSKYLEALIEKYRPAVCVFDPLQSFIGSVKMNERNSMRLKMRPLIEWGKKYGTTFIVIMHTNKLQNAWGRNRMADSADLWDIARCVLMVGDTEDPKIKYLSHEKSNYGQTGKTLLFTNERGNPVFSSWTDQKDKDFVLTASKARSSDGNTAIEDACNFILSELADNDGKMPVSELNDELKAFDYSTYIIRYAKQKLKQANKICIKKDGYEGRNYIHTV